MAESRSPFSNAEAGRKSQNIDDYLEATEPLEAQTEDDSTSSTPAGHREALNRLKVPLFFLGIGVYRAWIEIVYINPSLSYPAQAIGGRDLFDWSFIVVLFVMAVFARRLTPLYDKRWVTASMTVLLLGSTAINFLSFIWPDAIGGLGVVAAIAGGLGIAVMVLLWSEFFGTLNPVRVALYYSGSIVLGALIVYVYRGFYLPWLGVFTLALPVVALACLFSSYRHTSPDARPKAVWGDFTFPWKPTLLMAVYAFAYGLREVVSYDIFGPHSAFGTLAVGVIVFLMVAFQGKRFDLTIIYRAGLPVMVIGLLLFSAFGSAATSVSSFCVTGSYTAFSILIMIICANLCYRYGASAVFIFGIERGVRSVFMFLGRQTEQVISTSQLTAETQQLAIAGAVVVLLVVCTMMLLSEKELTSNWGMTMRPESAATSPEVQNLNRMGTACAKLARECGLSHRESEVLLLIAQRKPMSAIESELFISNNTAKVHVRHIYRKTDVHSRDELLQKMGLE